MLRGQLTDLALELASLQMRIGGSFRNSSYPQYFRAAVTSLQGWPWLTAARKPLG